MRCYSREELTTVGCIFTLPELKGKNFAIITHAGGPGVMLTDALSKGGLNVPKLEGPVAEELKGKLSPVRLWGIPLIFWLRVRRNICASVWSIVRRSLTILML